MSPTGTGRFEAEVSLTEGPPVCLDDVERLAASRVPADVWDFVQGGSGSERTLEANRAALDDVALVPRVLRGAGAGNTHTRLVGTACAMPVAIAPMAYHRLLHPEGELAMAAAARAADVPFTVGMLSSCSLESIAQVGASIWFQLYWLSDRGRMLGLIGRAEQAGCRALVITVDVPVMGRRLRDLRNEFVLPSWVSPVNLDAGPSEAHGRVAGGSAVAEHTRTVFDPSVTWQDLEWLREQSALPLIVKGVLDGGDAARAVACGADAVVVSNHGGRQLDGSPASVAVLPQVREAVGDDCQVLLDSGVRSGTDILRALALGASGVMVGRPLLWGLALGGATGAGQVLSLLRAEFADCLTLAGCADPGEAGGLRTLLGPKAALRQGPSGCGEGGHDH
ncbi:alpha-hydroxy acid oxidase [Streptomyces sp. H27-H1]|uniref:alpha-hydroxy acid oxidase n=1 Tax=Streptomyces sp. H27-H1 TaxID=2996461 RepID=UPI0022703028|nr:alpha-hydroxy acid oxidase [Streptomyces sp. H27-H1]MCY0931126.1 alpha-hydroxy acid oxidase [Streptomyces sp. H27-H1]